MDADRVDAHIAEKARSSSELSRHLLPLLPAGLSVLQVLPEPDRITILTASKSTGSACPLCGGASNRVHSRYTRTLADLPWQGRRVALRVRARRFRCITAGCQRRIFTERFAALALPSARRTIRLGDAQRHIGLALGGEPGSRLANRLAMPISGDTLLRLIRAIALKQPVAPRVIGIDEWAWRRGMTYGTILCDLERGRIIDLLPDRKADTVAAWLRQHPGVSVIARDRAGVYAGGIRQGAPGAMQVADRWHLLRNLGDALRVAVGRHRTAIGIVAQAVSAAPEPAAGSLAEPKKTKLDALRRERRKQRRDCYAEIRRMREGDVPPRLIAPMAGMSKRTVERWLAAGGEPEHHRPPVPTLIDPFRSDLDQRWQEGCRNAAALWREIKQQGFTGSFNTVARWAASRRTSEEPIPDIVKARRMTRWQVPSRRECAWLLTADPTTLADKPRIFIERLRQAAPALARAADLARQFAAMLHGGDAGEIEAWLVAARGSPLASFAHGIARDLAAVRAAITEPWSTSPVEGHINRLKTIKRQMYGRAHYDLLRKRVLAAA
jgi:transposase